MLQNNSMTGLLFLVGIFYNSILMGVGAMIGVLTGTIAAYIFKYDRQDITDGLFGFNGTLVGIALLLFFQPTILLFVAVILGSILSTLIMHVMHEKKLHPYTFPFVLSTWIVILAIKILDFSPRIVQDLQAAFEIDIIAALSMGFGQVMLQANIVTGAIFLVAILVNSHRAAAYAIAGSLLGISVAFGLSLPFNLINLGVFGFNGVLCGIAFSDRKALSWAYASISIIFSVFIMYGMITFNWIALTAPFVFATWITLGLRNWFNFYIKQKL